MGTAIVGAIILGIVICIIKNMLQKKRNGISIQCGCDCKNCGGHCHEGNDR